MKKGINAEPISKYTLVAAHIKVTYPKGVVLLCEADSNGVFDRELLEAAFGEEVTDDISSGFGDLCVLEFEEGMTVAELDAQLEAAVNELGRPLEDLDSYTVFVDGVISMPE